ncbi:MAG: DUF86 domain-containing protein [Planctomycetes bacterium]|nr:DUF86 domain-containing protein [Planctomycetota bacterium]
MDPAILAKHLLRIEESVELLKQRAKPAELETDVRELYFVAYALQTAIQAALDVAAMIVSLRRLGEPRTNREIFRKLAQDGWITMTDGEAWLGIVSFRNIVVHRYLDVDPIIVRDILEKHLDDLSRFARNVGQRLRHLQPPP